MLVYGASRCIFFFFLQERWRSICRLLGARIVSLCRSFCSKVEDLRNGTTLQKAAGSILMVAVATLIYAVGRCKRKNIHNCMLCKQVRLSQPKSTRIHCAHAQLSVAKPPLLVMSFFASMAISGKCLEWYSCHVRCTDILPQ